MTDPRTDRAAAPRPRHDERLRPAGWVWASAAGLCVSAGVLVVPVAATAALPVTAAVAVLLAVALVRSSPRVRVDASGLQAGRARLPWAALGEVTPLEPAEMRTELGVGLNALAFLCIRGWVPGGVKVAVADDDDPTPYWLVSSRRPAALAAALTDRR